MNSSLPKRTQPLYFTPAGQGTDDLWNAAQPSVLLPGAFNPLHEAHLALAAIAQRLENKPVAFELSIANVDKQELAELDVKRRLEQFAGKAPLWLTYAALFTDKAGLFPGAIFAIGADTAARLVAPRYYANGPQGIDEALEYIAAQKCSFLVAGRIDTAGRFVGLEKIAIPTRHLSLFRAIPESDFRMDLSSTMLRR